MRPAGNSAASHEVSAAWNPPASSARRYTLLRRLAVGGMGELLLARASAPGGVQKLVAIKRVRSEYASDPTFVSMFLNEARLAATLDHPNVVRTYDLVEDAGSFFMVMEYLHGHSLGRLLNAANEAGASMPVQHCVTIALGVAAGLHCAHERCGVDGRPLDIVHRDLSPGNVFVTYEGGVKLLDFGIAKATSRTSITLGPARKGKVSYMSPEQCVGDDIDRRSDIFALGIVMWEACTGRRLFRGDNEFGIMNQITTIDAPSPREHVPELPQELCDVIARALERDRGTRFQTAMDLHDAIEAFASGAGLLPSSAALGRYVEDRCGRDEFPSASASPEFLHTAGATLVVPAAQTQARPRPRSFSLVLALAAGAIGGAFAVGASSSDEPPPAPAVIATPPGPAAPSPESAAPQVGLPAGRAHEAVRAQDPALDTLGEPDGKPSVSEAEPTVPVPKSRRGRAGRSRKPAVRPKSTPEATPEGNDKAVRGLDGLLPRG